MKILKKREKPILIFLIILFILFLKIAIVSSAVIVQAPQEQQEEEKGGFFSFFASPIFWGAVLFFIVAVVVLILIFFIVRWIVSFFKARADIYYMLKKKRIYLSKIQKTYPQSKHWWKVQKNVPIRLVKIGNNGKPVITSPIAYHRGDYTTSEGNIVISFNMSGHNRLFLFPITEVLVIPNFSKIQVQQRIGEKVNKIEIEGIPNAKDIVHFNDNEILLYAEGISHAGQFFIPVLKSKEGKIIDLTLPIYQSLKEVILGDYLYIQTSEFTSIARKSIDMNPNLRYQQRVADQNQSVEAQVK